MNRQLHTSSIHTSSIIVDAHCDILTVLAQEKCSLKASRDSGHVDLPRLRKGGVKVQFFAAFISPQYRGNYLRRAMELFDRFYCELDECSKEIMLVRDFNDLVKSLELDKIAAVLTIEGGEALEGRIEVLRMFYRLGVRCLTLTWNGRNELGDGVAETWTCGGLTKFGVEVVKEMNRLNMLIDVSHLSEAGFWNVLEISTQPVIASHSNSGTVCPHPRNLTDKQIKALAAGDGVMGLTFVPDFIHQKSPSLERFLDHIDYIVSIAGTDCIGLGSDFDGYSRRLEGLGDAGDLPYLTEGLLCRGYTEEDIRKFLGGNFLRLFKKLWNGKTGEGIVC